MQDISIRHAMPVDAPLLAMIGAKTFRDAFIEDNTPENMEAYLQHAFSPALQAAEVADAVNCFLLAEADGEAIGYTKLRARKPPACMENINAVELQRIYVLKQWIGRGVGAKLMQASLEEAKTRGYAIIWLGVWENNPRAIIFYRKWGFEQVGTHQFQLGDDPQTDLLMCRRL